MTTWVRMTLNGNFEVGFFGLDWEANHGSRFDRHLRLQQIEDKEKIAKERKTQQFDKALEKANLESLKLKFQAEDVEVCVIPCCCIKE